MSDVRITINPTSRCTMKCNYCKWWEHVSSRKHALSLQEVNNEIQTIIGLISNINKISVHFNALDVFLAWKELIKPFIEQHSQEYEITIHSNGILLSDDKIMFFKKHNVRVLISLDGPQEVQDINRKFNNNKSSFDFVYSKIKRMKELGCKFSVVATFNDQSINKIFDSYNFFIKEQFFFSFLFDTKYSTYQEDVLIEQFNKIACDFKNRSIKEKKCFRDFYRSIKPNDSAYHFAINMHGISTKINKHTFKTFARCYEDGTQDIDSSITEESFNKKISSKCGRNKQECINCPAFHGEFSPASNYNMEIYCKLLTTIFNNIDKESVTQCLLE